MLNLKVKKMKSENRIKILQSLEKQAESLSILKKISSETDINMAADADAYAEDFFQKALAIIIEDIE